MNKTFKILYGIEPHDIQPTVVIMPFDIPQATTHLGIPKLTPGRLFAGGQGPGITLIRSGMSAGFVGDCILWLKDTPCKKILFLGTCGLIRHKNDLSIGSVLAPQTVYALESFSAIVTDSVQEPARLPVDNLFDRTIPPCSCASFASLHEEARYRPTFERLGIDVIEMECSAFFLAASKIDRRAGALLIVSDILGDKDICFNLSAENKKRLAEGINQACATIKNMTAAKIEC